eukprot:scaffold73265_cov69-Phaeocystis_antarctica.AAC.2
MLTLSCSAHLAYSPLAQVALASALLAAHRTAAASFSACLPASSGHCSPDADAEAREAASHDQPRLLSGREGGVRGVPPCERGGSVTPKLSGAPPSQLGLPTRSGCSSGVPSCSAAVDDRVSAADNDRLPPPLPTAARA